MRKRDTSPISETIWAPVAYDTPGIVSTSGSTSSSRALTLASTFAHSESANSICLIRDLTWNEAAS